MRMLTGITLPSASGDRFHLGPRPSYR
jgi:hypothetical protein